MIDNAYIDTTQIHRTTAYALEEITGIGSPIPRADRTERAQRHGMSDRTSFYSGRVIGLKGVVQGDDTGEMWDNFDALRGLFQLGTTHTFRFLRTGKYESESCTVTVSSELDAAIRSVGRIMRWGITLVAADPRLYVDTVRFDTYDPLAVITGGGVDMPLDFPLVFESPADSHLVLNNAGTFPTPPIFTIQGPVNDPVIDHDGLLQSISLQYNLGASDTVTLDIADRVCLLNGAPRPDLVVARSSTWFELVPGNNPIRLRGTGMESGATTLAASYKDAYI